ncbi:MAG: hypothetical protein COB50_01810 [Thiotrichales bacterium]|nr:MAG: hypothetical protein COB50_01810 [Thiotrichales bacterium]
MKDNYYKIIAKENNLTYVHLSKKYINTKLLSKSENNIYVKLKAIPTKQDKQGFHVVTADISSKNLKLIKKKWGNNVKLSIAPVQLIIFQLNEHCCEAFAKDIDTDLPKQYPQFSAKQTFCLWQKIALVLIVVSTILSFILNHEDAFFILLVVLEVIVLLMCIHRLLIVFYRIIFVKTPPDILLDTTGSKSEKPFYTVLVPIL